MRRAALLLFLIVIGATIGPAIGSAAAPQTNEDLAAVPRMSLAEFKQALAAGTILVLDARDEGSYANGHVPGAVNVPLADIDRHAKELKAEKRPIVAYCA